MSGNVSDGNPFGIAPTVETPDPDRSKYQEAAIATAIATSDAGEWGHHRSKPITTASVARPTASVRSEVAGRCCAIARRSAKKPCLAMCSPNSLGTWSSTMTSAIPALKPVSTGVEMKVATNPSRRIRAAIRNAPTSSVSVAVAMASLTASPSGTARPSSVPVRMASVVVELTLSTRDVPRNAYSAIGTNDV